jgi:cell wall-associated NlpC family hydrolase
MVPAPAILPLTLPDPAIDHAAILGNELRLRGEINFWLGTPYQRGGTNRLGIDCSGFVQQIYRSAFAIELPRTAAEQVQFGDPVTSGDLEPGDLLVFRIRETRNHVGIYLGRDDFVHASPRRGITIASLREPHWQQALRGARRLQRGSTAERLPRG